MREKRKNLKQALAKGKLIKIVGAHNGLTAKLVEEAGFDGVWASGFEISTSHAVPDANILTMSDFLNASSEMANVTSVPVIADCDTGFGNANNVMHMVKKYEAAGVAAVCIEDKKFPKVNSFISGRQELASILEFSGKVMAAKSVQTSEDFMVFARVEALIAGWGIDEALKRAQAYFEAGADGIFIHSKSKQPDEIINFCKAWKKKSPLLICPTTYHIAEAEMKELGVNIVIYANQAMRSAIKSIKETLDYMKEKGTQGLNSQIVAMDEVFRLQGMLAMKSEEKKYLKSEKGSLKAIIPAAGQDIDESLKAVLKKAPLGMLDINGKSLLARNIETLNIAGVQNVNVVVGYGSDKVKLEGAKLVANKEFETKGIMHSVIGGIDEIVDKNLIIYSDVILDQHMLDKLLKKEGDIILAVDSSYKKTNYRNKKLELVTTKHSMFNSKRTLDVKKNNPILKIGKNISEDEGHYEFIGVALVSAKGIQIILDEYKKEKFEDKFSFADFMQHLIDKQYEILAYEVSGGWMEIHNFSDYKNACSIFS